ncbi:MAG: hypothetical protein HZB38_02755, partial [Planctomycetes bacterium]|nr:hypothetical protein [Planctomycetota bacterium]
MSAARFQVAADVLDGWRDSVLCGTPPVLYPIGAGELARIEVGPGLVTLIGGAPGAGKTAFTMQAAVDALRLTPTLRALVCNVEMPPPVLLDRQLARLSGVDLTTIRYRRLGAEHANRIDAGLNTLAAVADRLCFVRPPFDLGNVAAAADDFGAGLLLLDYIQRIDPPGAADEARHRVNKLGAMRISELTPSAVQAAIGEFRKVKSLQTCQHYLRAMKQFSRWLERDGRVRNDALAHLTGFNAATDRRYERRALDADEFGRLVQTTETAPQWRQSLTGADRAMLYRVAAGTGFRVGELASLTPASFSLGGDDPPAIMLDAKRSKRRKADVQPIRSELAASLRSWLKGKPASAP